MRGPSHCEFSTLLQNKNIHQRAREFISKELSIGNIERNAKVEAVLEPGRGELLRATWGAQGWRVSSRLVKDANLTCSSTIGVLNPLSKRMATSAPATSKERSKKDGRHMITSELWPGNFAQCKERRLVRQDLTVLRGPKYLVRGQDLARTQRILGWRRPELTHWIDTSLEVITMCPALQFTYIYIFFGAIVLQLANPRSQPLVPMVRPRSNLVTAGRAVPSSQG